MSPDTGCANARSCRQHASPEQEKVTAMVHSSASDATQDVFLSAYRGIQRYKGDSFIDVAPSHGRLSGSGHVKYLMEACMERDQTANPARPNEHETYNEAHNMDRAAQSGSEGAFGADKPPSDRECQVVCVNGFPRRLQRKPSLEPNRQLVADLRPVEDRCRPLLGDPLRHQIQQFSRRICTW